MDPSLLEIATSGNLDLLIQIADQNPNSVFQTTSNKNTALHIAARHGHTDLAAEISKRCPPLLLAENSLGDTPLHVAARAGHLTFVAELFVCANRCRSGLWVEMVRKRNAENNTAMHEATRSGHHGVVKLLTIEEPHPPLPFLLKSRPRRWSANGAEIRGHFEAMEERRSHGMQLPLTTTPLLIDEKLEMVVHLERRASPLRLSMEKEELWKRRCIYRVPTYISDINSKAYMPRLVSIGPYHHGEPHLMSMEEHKQRALHRFLIRSRKPYEDFVTAIEKVVEKLMDCYGQLDDAWKEKDKFIELMTVDGCFLIEVLRSFKGRTMGDYDIDDPVFSSSGLEGLFTHLIRDMLMIENQLPMLVLERLLAVDNGKAAEENEKFIKDVVLEASTYDRPPPDVGKCLHMLDIYRKAKIHGATHIYKADPQGPYKRMADSPSKVVIARSATELHDAGVKFRKSRTYSFKDITFNGGCLGLPVFFVRDINETIFLNAIAFEQLHPGTKCELRSYFFFLACLLKSEKDVRLLQSEKIIQCTIACDETSIFKLINHLATDNMITGPNNSFYIIQQQLDSHHRRNMVKWSKRLRHWRLHLKNTYFKNPWTFLSLVAAAVLLGLTSIQTYYAVYKRN